MKTPALKTLSLKRETLRSLSSQDLRTAAGGGEGFDTDGTVIVCLNTGCCMCGCKPKKY